MMKSALLAGAAAILLTTGVANAQSDSYRCDEFGCELVPRGGSGNRRRLAVEDRYHQWSGARDGVYCKDGLCSIDDGECRDGQCRINGGYCADGSCCPDGQCDHLSNDSDCADGRCDISRRQPTGRRDSFSYSDERYRETDSRHLDNPFRAAGHRNGGFRGNGRPDSRPIPTRFEPVRYESQRPSFSRVHWNSDLRRAAAIAARENRPLLVQVTAPWCSHCQRMKQETWTDRGVANAINDNFVAVEVNAEDHRQFLEDMQIQSLPTTLVVSPNLNVLNRVQGFQSANQMLQMLSR